MIFACPNIYFACFPRFHRLPVLQMFAKLIVAIVCVDRECLLSTSVYYSC